MMAHACNARTLDVEAGVSKVQDHPWLHIVFEASLDKVSHKTVKYPRKRGTLDYKASKVKDLI